jgi:hypothetical protein
MRVALRIERLVLDGVELTRQERAALGPAIERALSHRLARRAGPLGDRAIATPPGGRGGARIERLGAQIADAVHGHVPGAGGSR